MMKRILSLYLLLSACLALASCALAQMPLNLMKGVLGAGTRMVSSAQQGSPAAPLRLETGELERSRDELGVEPLVTPEPRNESVALR